VLRLVTAELVTPTLLVLQAAATPAIQQTPATWQHSANNNYTEGKSKLAH